MQNDPWTFDWAAQAGAVGVPGFLPYYDQERSVSFDRPVNVDLDGDGLVDFELVRERDSIPGDYFFNELNLLPLSNTQLYSSGVSHYIDSRSTTYIEWNSAWDGNSFTCSGTAEYDTFGSGSSYRFFGEFATNGFIGIRIQAMDGWHYGWLQVNTNRVYSGFALNPWPDQGILSGVAAPPVLQIQQDNTGVPIVRWPAALPVVLDRSAVGGLPQWFPVPVTTPGQYQSYPPRQPLYSIVTRLVR